MLKTTQMSKFFIKHNAAIADLTTKNILYLKMLNHYPGFCLKLTEIFKISNLKFKRLEITSIAMTSINCNDM